MKKCASIEMDREKLDSMDRRAENNARNDNKAKPTLQKKQALQEIKTRVSARESLYNFLRLKWERYNLAPFLENWHFIYLSEILSHTDHHYAKEKGAENITRLMLNMPPSYGKTELLARTYIAWSLGRNKQKKFIYISYSDDLCRKISNQVRDLMKSRFYQQIFGETLFLQDNASEFILKEGGGLFVTTLKSAITGFHAHQILIDDPIKVSEMSSKAARDLVNQNFKESVLSRLQDNHSNITILMQRLGDDDLCGFLLNPKHFDPHTINAWRIETLKALESTPKTYTIANYTYHRQAGEPLFAKRHNAKELDELKAQMGNDEFSTQYLQEPLVSESGYFDPALFKLVHSYELGESLEYIFVDNATSTNTKADNRAIVVVSVESIESANRYCVRDCIYGIWEESQTASHIIDIGLKYPKARIFIESDGGGIALERILHQEIIKANTKLKAHAQPLMTNSIEVYTPSRKLAKVDKIKAIKPFYNTGYLCFSASAQGLGQMKRELFSFNPEKPFRKDDCIDALASAINHASVKAPSQRAQKPLESRGRRFSAGRRVAWNI